MIKWWRKGTSLLNVIMGNDWWRWRRFLTMTFIILRKVVKKDSQQGTARYTVIKGWWLMTVTMIPNNDHKSSPSSVLDKWSSFDDLQLTTLHCGLLFIVWSESISQRQEKGQKNDTFLFLSFKMFERMPSFSLNSLIGSGCRHNKCCDKKDYVQTTYILYCKY